MISRLEHRGPDGSGIWVRENVGLGHRRLAIRDLSDGGRQPMEDETGSIHVSCNGEIYNDIDLRRTLEREQGTRFKTTCDAEVIAPAYRHWGTDVFSKFEGMFAVAIWDETRQRLILARDPIGIKPLYFSLVGKSIRFGSEIKALLALPDQPRTLSVEGINSFLAQGYPGPEKSLLNGITPVPPGSYLIADRDGITIERYWAPKRTGELHKLDDAVDAFHELWRTVVGDLLVSDVPVGLLLSGGIDSALVATALKGRSGVGAYTARFRETAFDETGLSSFAAKYANLDQKFVSIDTDDQLEARFLDVVAKSDGQLADSSSLAFHALCEKAKGDVRVLLTGDGADEFFGGYETYRATRMAALLRPVLPSPAAAAIAGLAAAFSGLNRGRVSGADKIARFFAGIANGPDCPHAQWRRYLFPEDARQLLGKEMLDLSSRVDPLADYNAAYDKNLPPIDAALLADQRYYLPGDLLMKSDAMSMAHGVEIRVPFMDTRIMEFANRLHPSLLTPLRGPDKRLLRESLAALDLPREVTRASKRGFNVPVDAYLRGPLKTLGNRLLDQQAERLEPFFRPDAIRNAWREHIDGTSRLSYVLWSALTFAAWREIADL